ncbi:uncharacterized protein LOC143295443 [Babylonia areolata]|uniref:uncharacterized protein LOC143295443 n=1 Tax=Babylonia areolata TaxID=304850 RepID=UPI003FD234F0
MKSLILLMWILPASLASKQCYWEPKTNTIGIPSLNSHLKTKLSVPSVHECKAWCVQTPFCVAADWIPPHFKCVLYKRLPHVRFEKGCIHFLYNCTQVPCTRYERWCIKGAQCINQTCVCPPEAPKGDGAIECVPEDKILCMVDCDPKVKSWGGAVVPINLPCWYHVTDFVVYGPTLKYNYNLCRVQIHALNKLTDRGLFFVQRVLLKVWLGRRKPNGQFSFPPFSSFHQDLNHDDIWRAVETFGTPFFKTPQTYLLDLVINRHIDGKDRFAVIKIKQCWVRIKFRPFDPDHQPQEHKPGVTVMAPKYAKFRSDNKFSTVCLTPEQGPTAYEDYARLHALTSGQELILHNILLQGAAAQKPDLNHENVEQCTAVAENFSHDDCEEYRAFTIQLCAPILNHRRLVLCFMNRGVNPMDVFQACVNWGCLGSEAHCNLYREYFTFCRSTPFMLQVGCSQSEREVISQTLYSVAASSSQPEEEF